MQNAFVPGSNQANIYADATGYQGVPQLTAAVGNSYDTDPTTRDAFRATGRGLYSGTNTAVKLTGALAKGWNNLGQNIAIHWP